MAKKIKVGAVSYLNTKPLIYGFEQGGMKEEIDLLIDYPANIAALLQQNEISIGLIPVATIPSLTKSHIISDYCISCNGEVASVCLFSDVEIDKIEIILLDYQSRTSVALLKILLKEYWKISPQLVIAGTGYEKNIAGTTAGLVIGDRAFRQRLVSTYFFDLGDAWKQLTGLPFVFAAWVSNSILSPDFIDKFDATVQMGLNNLQQIVIDNPYPYFNLYDYYTRCIEYRTSAEKMLSLDLFLQKISHSYNLAIKMS